MEMRCAVERNEEAKDPYGQNIPGWTVVDSSVPCYAWNKSGSAVIRDEGIVSKDQLALAMPIGTDIRQHDRINKVKDRQGNELFDILIIDAILKRRDRVEVRMRGHA